jgi:hypothetical protein
MKGAMSPKAMTGMKSTAPMLARHERMIRRATNHNLHVITPHGKIMVGRKGRAS